MHSFFFFENKNNEFTISTGGQYSKIIVNRIEVSQDKKYLGCACSNSIQIYDLLSNKAEDSKMQVQPSYRIRPPSPPCSETKKLRKFDWWDQFAIYFAVEGANKKEEEEMKNHHANQFQKEVGGYNNNVMQIGFQKDVKWIYTCSEDGTVRIHDFRQNGFARMYSNKVPVNTAVLHPNEAEIIAGDAAGNIKIYDLQADKCRATIVCFLLASPPQLARC